MSSSPISTPSEVSEYRPYNGQQQPITPPSNNKYTHFTIARFGKETTDGKDIEIRERMPTVYESSLLYRGVNDTENLPEMIFFV